MKIAVYATCLSHAQWALLQPLLPKPSQRGRPPTDRRRLINAILYVVKGVAQWRLLPVNFPPWKTIYHIFRQWTLDGTWERLNAKLRGRVRQTQGKQIGPTAAILAKPKNSFGSILSHTLILT